MISSQVIEKSSKIIIKIGSVLVTDKQKGAILQDWLNCLAQDVQSLTKQGKKVVIVSSGAVALGRKALGIANDTPPGAIPLEYKQAASAVGQFHLFNGYFKAFSALNIDVAQVLLTMSETENRRMHLNARETLYTLMGRGIIPVINENDTISTGEIRFGDNDRLAARVGQMIEADAVILLSTTHGLYTDNPDTNPDAKHLPVIEGISDEHIKMAGEAVAGLSTGGMKSKVEAAQAVNRAGIPLIIAHGIQNHALKALCEDKTKLSSVFVARESSQNARKKWLQAHLSPKGSVIIDDGALKALNDGRSLLPIGVKSIEGAFERGDVVRVKGADGGEIGIGLSAYNSADALKIMGRRSQDISTILGYAGRDEMIHRNDLVLKI